MSWEKRYQGEITISGKVQDAHDFSYRKTEAEALEDAATEFGFLSDDEKRRGQYYAISVTVEIDDATGEVVGNR